MKDIKRAVIVFMLSILAVGCATGTYEQEAGVYAKWPEQNTNNALHVLYSFDPGTGNVTSIEVGVTNAVDAYIADASTLKAKSAISKSEVAKIAGTRQGMLDNNAGVEGEGLSTEEKLSDVIEKAGEAGAKIKSPIPVP